jgi:hypothetical protein
MMTEREYMEALLTRDTLTFAKYFHKRRHKRRYIVAKHHEMIAAALDRVLRGETYRLMINIFPRSGKTELAVKNFVALGLAVNPAARFMHLTFSNELALDNSEEIRDDFVQSPDYRAVFPYVALDKSSTAKGKWNTTAGGGMYAVSAGGAVTGFGAGEVDDITDDELDAFYTGNPEANDMELIDYINGISGTAGFNGAIIIDDPLKPEDAESEIKRERINNRWTRTIKSRANSARTPIIIIGQRLHPNDFCGHILESEPDEWEVLSIPALYYEDGKPRSIWQSKITVNDLLKIKERDSFAFDAQYQQDPTSPEGLILPLADMLTYDPEEVEFTAADYRMISVDPSDKGDDFAAPAAYVKGDYIYIDEWICNNEGLDANIPAVVDMATRHQPNDMRIEGNGGWIQTGKDIRDVVWDKCPATSVVITNAHENKEARIEAQAYYTRSHVKFRKDWATIPNYAKAVRCITSYVRGQKNKNDDAMDVLSDVIAHVRRNNMI